WLRRRGAFTPKRTLALLALVLLLYFCHLISVAMAALVIGTLTAWRVAADLAAARRGGLLTRGACRAALPAPPPAPVPAVPPPLALGAHFLSRRQGGPPHTDAFAAGGVPPTTLPGLLRGLVELEALVSYQLVEGLVTLPLGAGLLLLAAYLLF